MIDAIQNAIIAALADIPGVAAVSAWAGDVGDLLRTPQRLPALHVVYQGADFEPFDQAGEATTASLDFLIVLVAQQAKSRAAGALTAYGLIEKVRDRLIARQIGDYDFLRPVKEDLVASDGGVLVYGLSYQLSQVPVETALRRSITA